MKRKALGRDIGLTLHMVVVAVLVLAMYAGLLWLFWWAGQRYWILWIFFPAVVFVGYASGTAPGEVERVRGRGRRRRPREDAAVIDDHVARLAALADVPKPRVSVTVSETPNAYTMGWTAGTATIVVTTALVDLLDDAELEAVLAHELAHVINRDAMVMSSAAFVPRVGSVLFNMVPLLSPLGAVVYLFGTLLTVALSRYREYSADRGSAVLTGAPEQLMSALEKITHGVDAIPRSDLRAAAGLSAFFIVAAAPPRWFELASTHPPLERRLEALAELAREMGKVA
jgi:heat shock protein HtpX